MNTTMDYPILTIRPNTYPSLKYANFLTEILNCNEESDWNIPIELGRFTYEDNTIYESLKRFYGFNDIIKRIKSILLTDLNNVLNDDMLDYYNVYWGEDELEDENREVYFDGENMKGLINTKKLRWRLCGKEWEMDSFKILNGDIFADMNIMADSYPMDEWEEIYEHDMDRHKHLPYQVYMKKLFHYIVDIIDDRQKEYIIDLKKRKTIEIAEWFKEQYYSPYTKIGRKRFYREREELFGECNVIQKIELYATNQSMVAI
jgi:hypothetical protein